MNEMKKFIYFVYDLWLKNIYMKFMHKFIPIFNVHAYEYVK